MCSSKESIDSFISHIKTNIISEPDDSIEYTLNITIPLLIIKTKRFNLDKQYDKSIKQSEFILKNYNDIIIKSQKLELKYIIGINYYLMEKYEKCMIYLNNLYPVYVQEFKKKRQSFIIKLYISNSEYNLKLFENAKKSYEQLLKNYNTSFTTNNYENIHIKYNLGDCYYQLEEYDKSYEYFKTLIPIMEKNKKIKKDLIITVKYLIGLSLSKIDNKLNKEVKDIFETNLTDFENHIINKDNIIIHIKKYIGDYYFSINNYKKSIKYYTEVLDIYLYLGVNTENFKEYCKIEERLGDCFYQKRQSVQCHDYISNKNVNELSALCHYNSIYMELESMELETEDLIVKNRLETKIKSCLQYIIKKIKTLGQSDNYIKSTEHYIEDEISKNIILKYNLYDENV